MRRRAESREPSKRDFDGFLRSRGAESFSSAPRNFEKKMNFENEIYLEKLHLRQKFSKKFAPTAGYFLVQHF